MDIIICADPTFISCFRARTPHTRYTRAEPNPLDARIIHSIYLVGMYECVCAHGGACAHVAKERWS